MAFEFINTDNAEDDEVSLNLEGARDVATAVVNGTTYVFAVGMHDDGISVFSVDADGMLVSVDDVNDTEDASFELDFPVSVTTATVGGTSYLFVAGGTDDGISVFSIGNDGTLTSADNVPNGGSLNLDGPSDLTTAVVGTTTYLFVASSSSNGVSVFSVANDGTLTGTDDVDDTDDGSYELTGASQLATAVVGGTTFLFVAGSEFGTSVFSVNSEGKLTSAHNVGSTHSGVGGMVTAEVDGTSFLFISSVNGDRINTYSIASDGTLTAVPAGTVLDDDDISLNSPRGLATAEIDGVSYLFAVAHVDDGVTAFTIAPNGTLEPVAATVMADNTELNDPWNLTTIVIEGIPFLFVASGTGDAVNAYRLQNNVIDEAAEDVEVEENTTEVITVAKVEADDDVTYSLGGADAALFTIDVDGMLSFISAPDIDAPQDANGDNVYEVEVTALVELIAGGETFEETKELSVTVSNIGIVGEAAEVVEVEENTTVVATVAKVAGADTVTFSLGGADAALFTVDADGLVAFVTAPDFENPQDADGDNVYDVTVVAEIEPASGEDTFEESKDLSIAVTNIAGLTLVGTKKAETLSGGDEEDTLKGKNGKDTLDGQGGNDLLQGGKNKDKLTGGDGADGFLFSDKVKAKHRDKITDFEVGIDTIQLNDAKFKNIGGEGALKGKYFALGKKAKDGNDHVLFQKNKGWIRYDKDGKGGKDAVKVAKVESGLSISNDDFLIV